MSDERKLSIEDLLRLAEKTAKQRDDLAKVRAVVAPLSSNPEGLWIVTVIDGRALRLRGMQERYQRMAAEQIEQKRTENVGVLFVDGERMT